MSLPAPVADPLTTVHDPGGSAGIASRADATTTTLPLPRPHLRYLDGLRGVAILAVLMVHSGQKIAGLSAPVRDFTFYGVRGVQLFFIVSGLTLTLNYANRPFDAANFAARRFFRIAPMFYLGAVLYLTLAWTTSMPLPTRDATPLDVIATFLFLHGWIPSAINTVVPGGWSIAAEAMFYLVFPAILLLVPRRRLMAAVVLGTYLLAGLVNLVLRKVIGGPVGAAMSFPFWLVQLPAFASGCWLATLRAPAERWRGVAWVALAASIIGLAIDSQLRGRSNLLLAIALLTLFTWAAGVVRPKLLQSKLLVLIGQVSFSLYILQFAVLGLLEPLAKAVETAAGAFPALFAIFTAALIITGLLSYCSYRWIELPVINATRRIGRRRERA